MDRTYFAIVIVGLFALLFAWERWAPLRRATRPLRDRLFVNAAVATLAFAAAMLLVRPAALAVMQWTSTTSFGVVHLIPMGPGAQFILSFLLMDLTFYWWHVANHRVPFLWRLHNVHHIDPDLDVSTAFRFHAGEVAISTVFRVLQVSTIGLSAWMFA